MKKNLLTVFVSLFAFTQLLFAQVDKPRYQVVTHRAGTYLGTFNLELFPLVAPLASRNFDSLALALAFDSTAFHRVVPNFVIQGGDPNSINGPISTWGQGNVNQPTVDAEFSPVRHLRGRLGAARDADTNSASSQFYVCVANAFSLDGQYTVYGQVTSGMEVVDTIVNSPRNGNDVPLQKIEMFITYLGVNDSVPNPPLLIAPVNNAAGITSTTSFQWSAVNSAVMYTIEFSTDSLFSTIAITSNAGVNSATIATLIGSTHYYWRVKSNNGGHESGYSPVYSFTAATAAPLLINPHDTATNVFLNPVFQWASVVGSSSYTLQVSTSNVFVAPFLIYNQTGITDTTQQINGLNPNTSYYWRTRSANGITPGLFSVKYSFTTGTTLGVTDVNSSISNINVYPNPANDILYIEANIAEPGKVEVYLQDNLGKKVYEQSEKSSQQKFNTTIDVSKLSKGIYFLTIHANGKQMVKKVTIN